MQIPPPKTCDDSVRHECVPIVYRMWKYCERVDDPGRLPGRAGGIGARGRLTPSLTSSAAIWAPQETTGSTPSAANTRSWPRQRPSPLPQPRARIRPPGYGGEWMHISTSVRAITPSMTIGMDDRARRMQRQGIDVISFAAGEPDFDTPEVIKRAADEAIREGFTKYTAPAGIIELRQAVAARLEADYGARYAPEEVVITAGGKPALFYALRTLCEPGDEVLVPVPAWVSY